jgi:hypothetical protein
MKRNLFFLLLACLVGCKPTSPVTTLEVVLQGFESCPSRDGVQQQGDTASFTCSNSADTFYMVSLARFPGQAEAQTQFDAERGDLPLQCFHGYDQYEAVAGSMGNPFIVEEQLGWQADSWVLQISASYDYRFFHFTSSDFSEAVYAAALKHDLFPAGTCP